MRRAQRFSALFPSSTGHNRGRCVFRASPVELFVNENAEEMFGLRVPTPGKIPLLGGNEEVRRSDHAVLPLTTPRRVFKQFRFRVMGVPGAKSLH